MKISILGAGAWGTALAISLARQHDVRLWGRDAQQISDLQRLRENQRYLPAAPIPAPVLLTADLEAALRGADLMLCVVHTNALRDKAVL